MASEPKVEHQAAMVALGRPGAGEELLARYGFVDIERHDIPFVAEFADPEAYARAISSVGPAYEAIENIGEEAFVRSAIGVARQRVRDGLPLRAPIACVGYRRSQAVDGPAPAMPRSRRPRRSSTTRHLHRTLSGSSTTTCRGLATSATSTSSGLTIQPPSTACPSCSATSLLPASLTFRQRAILVTACASALGDSYCSLAWGKKLAGDAGATVAEGVLRGDDAALDDTERVLARWARQLARDPNSTTAADVQVAARRRLRRRPNLRHLRVRGPAHRLQHGQRRPRGPARSATRCRDPRRSPRRRHVRPADRSGP